MEESPSCNANRSSPSQEIPHNLWNPKVHYRIHNSLPPVPTLTQINKVHVLPSVFCTIHFNIIFPPTARFSEWSLLHRFPQQNTVWTSSVPHTCYIPSISYSSFIKTNSNRFPKKYSRSFFVMEGQCFL